jgi:hypothetical protein
MRRRQGHCRLDGFDDGKLGVINRRVSENCHEDAIWWYLIKFMLSSAVILVKGSETAWWMDPWVLWMGQDGHPYEPSEDRRPDPEDRIELELGRNRIGMLSHSNGMAVFSDTARTVYKSGGLGRLGDAGSAPIARSIGNQCDQGDRS